MSGDNGRRSMRTDDPIYTLTPPERRGRAKRRDSGWSTPLECGFRRLAGNSTGRVVPSFLSSSLGTRLSAKLCFVRAVGRSGTDAAGAAGQSACPSRSLGTSGCYENGFSTGTPAWRKSAVFRVATVRPCARAAAAMRLSFTGMARPFVFSRARRRAQAAAFAVSKSRKWRRWTPTGGSGVIKSGAGKSVVPEGQRKLAGGVSHRTRTPSELAPEGRWSGRRG